MTELFQHLALGFGIAFTVQNLCIALVGCLLGTLIGVLPGLGPMATIALLLPAAYALPPVGALILLAAIYYGAQYGGSTTAILANLPGETSSAVTVIDGYQMARRGRAGAALAAAGLGSFVAGCVGTLFIAALVVPLIDLAMSFGDAEYFALMVVALIGSVGLASGSVLKAVAMTVLGLLLGVLASDMGLGGGLALVGGLSLGHGIGFVILAIGVLAYGEVIAQLAQPQETPRPLDSPVGSLVPSREDARRMAPAVLRGTLLGSAVGVLPGGGALLSAITAYMLERKTRLLPGEPPFGEGNIRGVAAPESANNAGSQTAFIPLLALGIPPNAVMALVAGALLLHDIAPGPLVMGSEPALFWGLVASMWIGNLMLVILNLPLVGLWTRLMAVPYRWLFPAIVLVGAVGAYALDRQIGHVWGVVLFGAVGYAFFKLGLEPAPLLLGFVLGPMMAARLQGALQQSGGDWGVFISRPLSAALLVLGALLLGIVLLPRVKTRRDDAVAED